MKEREGKRKTLKTKLTWTIVGMSIVPMLILALFVYINNVRDGLDSFRAQIRREIAKVDDGLSSYFNAILTQVEILAENDDLKQIDERIREYITPAPDNADGTIAMRPEEGDPFEARIYRMFKRIKDVNPQFFSISLGVEKHGGFLMYPEKPRKTNYDARERGWYKKGRNADGNKAVSDLYVSMDGSNSVEVLHKVFDYSGTFAGVLNFSMDLQEFQEKISAVQIGETGFLFVVDRSGNIISHKNPEYIGKNIADLGIEEYRDVTSFPEGEVEHENEATGETSVMQAISSKNEVLGWTYILSLDMKEFNAIRDQRALLGSLTWIVLVVLVVAIVFSRIFAGRLSHPIVSLSRSAEKIAAFDLTESIDEKALAQPNEIGVLADSMERMIENLRNIVGNISDYSADTSNTAEALKGAVHDTSLSVREVSSAVGNIADGATLQAEDVQTAAHNIENITELLEGMSDTLGELASAMENIHQKKDEGREILTDLRDINLQSKERAHYVNEIILNTDGSVEKISQASSMIQALSDQTNLLALNASIEAARAGDAGRGFAVVADEIRKLAEASAGFTEEIGSVIGELKENSRNAVEIMQGVTGIIDQQNNKMEETREKFNEIEHAVERGKDIVQTENHSSEEIGRSNTAIIEIIQNLTAIAEENAATTQETAENVEAQASSVNRIFEASETLAAIAARLNDEAMAFKL